MRPQLLPMALAMMAAGLTVRLFNYLLHVYL